MKIDTTNAPETNLYHRLPQVGEFLNGARVRPLLERYARPVVADAARAFLAGLREEIARGTVDEEALRGSIEQMPDGVAALIEASEGNALRAVINATGVILQTNLGRAPLSERAIEAIASVARGYCNLEYDLERGERGRRGAYAEQLLLRALDRGAQDRGAQDRGAQDGAALVVNNCAAATFLALNTMAEGGEVIVSRGELVEIGGGFRVPDILRKSGARLREVGTTNRTRIEDYAAAINEDTRMILRVHRSNFEIVGFTEQPGLDELVRLGSDAGVPVFEDQGTGCMIAPEACGLGAQSSFARSVRSGAALVCASGDKLMGGPQCGLLAGEARMIRKLRDNPLYRALRVDKLTYAALEATLLAYVSGQAETLPVVRMLATPPERIRQRCEEWARALVSEKVSAEVIATESVVGGGTAPGTTLPRARGP